MLEDNIAFALMALNASSLEPKPPVALQLAYVLPYANFHEARTNWRPIFFAKLFQNADGLSSTNAVLGRLLNRSLYLNWTAQSWADEPASGASDGSAHYELQWASSTNPP